jgi:hypothetical protein
MGPRRRQIEKCSKVALARTVDTSQQTCGVDRWLTEGSLLQLLHPKSRARRLAFSGTICRAAALAAKSKGSKVAKLSRICVSSAGVVPNTLTLSDLEYLAAPSFQD